MSGWDDFSSVHRPAQLVSGWTRGDSWQLELNLRDAMGRRVDLSGLTGTWYTSRYGAETFQPAGLVTLDPTVGAPTGGDILVSLDPIETTALMAPRFAWMLRLSDGTLTKTVARGWLTELGTDHPSCGIGFDGLLTGEACQAPCSCCAETCQARVVLQACGTGVSLVG
jgi:hypothetical protein